MFIKLVLRQRDVLQMASCHAQILIYRPFLLPMSANVSEYESTATSELQTSRKEQISEYTQRCLDAATQIAEHIDRIDAAGELYSTLFVRRHSLPSYPGTCELTESSLVSLYPTTVSMR